MAIIFLLILGFPFALTIWNIMAFVSCLINHRDKAYHKAVEIIAMGIGMGYLRFYMELSEVMIADWNVTLYNNQLHSMIATDTFPTIYALAAIAFLGYLAARFIPAHRQPPLFSACSISALYLGIGLCILWCIQTYPDLFLLLYPANCILIFIKTIFLLVCKKNEQLQDKTVNTRFPKLSRILSNGTNLPWIALAFVIPLLGILVIILTLFGQVPDSIIKAWTETADWTFSQKLPPQSLHSDEHYLCTVAAGGHKKVVKPLRTGLRHGHRVVVNRQLCIANAFEQILEEKTPAFHKIVRGLYDKTGYPIAKHIHSPYAADIIYFVMKPLEWIFLAVIYLVDTTPENRIAVQYPHAAIPKL